MLAYYDTADDREAIIALVPEKPNGYRRLTTLLTTLKNGVANLLSFQRFEDPPSVQIPLSPPTESRSMNGSFAL